MASTAISAQGSILQIGTGAGGAKTISGVTVGNPTLITATAHGFSNGDSVALAGLTGADAATLNGQTATVLYKTANTIAVAIDTTGKTITPGSGTATPNTYTAIGNVKNFTGMDGSASEIDVTNLQSTAKELRLGLVDFGQFSITIDHDLGDAGQAALQAKYLSGAISNFKLILPAGTTPTASFQGFVKKFTAAGGVDQVVTKSVDIRISGPVAWS